MFQQTVVMSFFVLFCFVCFFVALLQFGIFVPNNSLCGDVELSESLKRNS